MNNSYYQPCIYSFYQNVKQISKKPCIRGVIMAMASYWHTITTYLRLTIIIGTGVRIRYCVLWWRMCLEFVTCRQFIAANALKVYADYAVYTRLYTLITCKLFKSKVIKTFSVEFVIFKILFCNWISFQVQDRWCMLILRNHMHLAIN